MTVRGRPPPGETVRWGSQPAPEPIPGDVRFQYAGIPQTARWAAAMFSACAALLHEMWKITESDWSPVGDWNHNSIWWFSPWSLLTGKAARRSPYFVVMGIVGRTAIPSHPVVSGDSFIV